MNEFLRAALDYAARGWRVFPLHSLDKNKQCTCGVKDCADAGKHPRVRRGMKEATSDEKRIREWFGDNAPSSNIGIATGSDSGITVLDVDVAPGKRGAETWAGLIREKGEPITLMARTGSGGMHLVFAYNSAMKTSANTLGPGVDCRNDGGYIVVAPSRHRSGGRYEWLNSEPVVPLPAHLTRKESVRGRPRRDDPTRARHSLEAVRGMLAVIPADDRDFWRAVGIILGREFSRSEEAWNAYVEWSNTWKGRKGRNHDAIMHEAFHELSQVSTDRELSIGSIVTRAIENGWTPRRGDVPLEAFIFYGPGNNFIYRVTSSFWIAEAVNAAVSPVNHEGRLWKPAEYLRRFAMATSMTDDPGIEGDFVRGVDCRDGALIPAPGAAVFNTYRPPTIEMGDARLAQPFIEHVRRVFPREGDADQFLNYMAHRVQKPAEKPRFALLIAGDQGVGKDTAVEFCVPAIGPWNVANIEPSALDSGFNEYASAVLIRLSEAANLHDMSRWAFNERMKVLIAGTPDNVVINPKYGQKYSVRMHCGVIITTNHMVTGIYIPSDDRRYDVIEAATKAAMGLEEEGKARDYFNDLWAWFLHNNGASHVAAFLAARDLSKFSAATGQRKTDAHRTVVSCSMTNDHWLLDVLMKLGEPKVVRADALTELLVRDGLNPKEYGAKMHAAMIRAGFSIHRNPNRKDGRWEFEERRLATVYARSGLTAAEIEEVRAGLKRAF